MGIMVTSKTKIRIFHRFSEAISNVTTVWYRDQGEMGLKGWIM